MAAPIKETECNEDTLLPPKIVQYCQQNSDNRVGAISVKDIHLFSKESLQQRLLEIQLIQKALDNRLNEIYDNEYVVFLL